MSTLIAHFWKPLIPTAYKSWLVSHKTGFIPPEVPAAPWKNPNLIFFKYFKAVMHWWYKKIPRCGMLGLVISNMTTFKSSPLHTYLRVFLFSKLTYLMCYLSSWQATLRAFPSSHHHSATSILELVHMDLCGPMKTNILGGARYDDFSRKIWLYLLAEKSQAFTKFQEWVALVENETSKKVRKIRSGQWWRVYLPSFPQLLCSTRHRSPVSTPNTPQENSVVERKNRTVQEMARTMQSQCALPLSFWGEAVNTTVYIINCCPTKAVAAMTIAEAFTGV